tara:strand:+ start:508 stop:1140 length:633 start_codon:yes stop_codon:yes gene_type:complete
MADGEHDYAERLGRALYYGLKDRMAVVTSCKGPLRTYATVSGTLDGYAAANPGSNSRAATAHQNLAHLKEEHPEFARCPQPDLNRPLDFYATGGVRPLAGEFEYGGRRAQADDRKKLTRRPPTEDKLFINPVHSSKARGKDEELFREASQDGGVYYHGEVYQRMNYPLDQAKLSLTGYANGKKIFDSKILDEREAIRERILTTCLDDGFE